MILNPESSESGIITEDTLILEDFQETVSVVSVGKSVLGWVWELEIESGSDNIEWLSNESRNSGGE